MCSLETSPEKFHKTQRKALAFLLIFKNFPEQLFYRTPVFYIFLIPYMVSPRPYSLAYSSKFYVNYYKCLILVTVYINLKFIFKRSQLRKKCPYLEFFQSVFSLIRTEYGDLFLKSLNSVRMMENTDQRNSEHGHFLRSFQCSVQFSTQQLPRVVL